MGLTYVRILVAKDLGSTPVPVRALVDTGATYSMIPRRILTSLGVTPTEKMPIRLGDGRRKTRDLGLAAVRYGKHATPTWVLFGEPGDTIVLGALTLEELALQVDPKSRTLRRVKIAVMAAAAASG
jgi:clan AA aspartic protease